MNIQLSDHFTYGRLIRFVIPSVAMMIFTSVYGVIDGLFVSNFVGKTPFAAVNLIIPFCMILGAFGFMFGTGGTALVAKTLGEGKKERANQIFSMLIYVALLLGILLALFGIVFVEPIALKLGADAAMLGYCVKYARVVLLGLPFFMLQNMFQSFLIAAEKPKMGLMVTIAAGVTNMVLDALFIAIFRWGVVGAAAATALSQFVGGVVPLAFFSRKNSSKLRISYQGTGVVSRHFTSMGIGHFSSIIAVIYRGC